MRRPSSNKSYVLKLATAILGCVIGILGNFLAGWLQHYVLDQVFAFVSVAGILVLTIAGFFIGVLLERRMPLIPIKKVAYWMLFILVTGSLVLATTLSWVYATLRPPTTYFLIDATKQMAPFFGDVVSQVPISTLPNDSIGLSIYGANTNGSTQCDSIKQLIEPNIYTDPRMKLVSVLSNIAPGGHSSLIRALFNTLKELNKHVEPIKLVVVTSGMDPECDPLYGSTSEDLTGIVKSNMNIVLISIGELGSRESYLLERYAIVLHASYWNIHTPAQLSQTILGVSSYGLQDYDYLYPKFTATPTP